MENRSAINNTDSPFDRYRCPNCAGDIKFDSAVQSMKCPYCGTKFDIATLDEHQKKIKSAVTGDFDWSATDESVIWEGADFDDLSSAACPSCGAEFFGNKNTAATVCPCCGNAQIITKHLSGGLKPDYVIPFRLEKKAAVAAMKEFCEGKRLLPDCFVQNNHIENTQGIYAPFWLFDAEAYGNLCFKTIKITSPKGGNEHHGSALRNGVLTFEKVPVDASEKMNDAFMDAIEPFDYADLKDFHKSFLAGYMAEKYDVSMEKCKTRAELRIEATLENEFKKSVKGYKSVTLENSDIKVKKGKISYGLFPVWVLNTKYNNENYQFIMNGQTGRLAGWLPTDRGKAFKYTAAIAGVTGALLTALLFILTTTGTFSMSLPPMILMAWCAAVAAGISVVHILESKMNTAREKTQACDYIVRGSLKFKVTKDDL